MVFVVICEAPADFRIASSLAIRVIREQVDWLDEESIPHLIEWRGRDAFNPFWL